MGAPDDPDFDANKTLGSTTLTDLRLPDEGDLCREGTLLVIAGTSADLGAHLVVRGEAVVGRDLGHLKLRDGRVSRKHVRVWLNDGVHFAEDLGSTNGSLLNGHPLKKPTPLSEGDRIYLGGTVLKFGLVDATEARYLERMARLAGTDPLTGLHAKHRFDSMAEEALRQARATGQPLALLMMDMDGLKSINDRHGHRMGAHTIATVGKALGKVLEGRGEACRFGGDEFCAYLPNTAQAEALAVAERIRATVEAGTYTLDGNTVHPTMSLGLAMAGPDTGTLGALVAQADAALYRAKAAGRNRVMA